MEELSNHYEDTLVEKNIQQDVILKKIQVNAKKMKDSVAQMQLGDDSKIDEAIMISFFASLYDDITKAYRAFQEFRLERKAENLEKEKGILQEKIDNIKEFKEQSERINTYTALNIEKTFLENKIKELEAEQKTNKENGVVEITDQPDELLSAQKRLTKVIQDMDDIAKFYEYTTNTDFMTDLEVAEKTWFGEDAALHMKGLRSLDSTSIEKMIQEIDSFPGDKEKLIMLAEAHKMIKENYENIGDVEKSAALLSEFNQALLTVQATNTIAQLAHEGEKIMIRENNEKRTKVQELF